MFYSLLTTESKSGVHLPGSVSLFRLCDLLYKQFVNPICKGSVDLYPIEKLNSLTTSFFPSLSTRATKKGEVEKKRNKVPCLCEDRICSFQLRQILNDDNIVDECCLDINCAYACQFFTDVCLLHPSNIIPEETMVSFQRSNPSCGIFMYVLQIVISVSALDFAN